MNVSILIPAYNEKSTIGEILRRVQAMNVAFEIVIVDDGSQDGTREILKAYNRVNNFKVIVHEPNQGKGAAIRTGIHNTMGDVIIIQDADLEYDPRKYFNLLRPIEKGITDVVYGSRFLGKKEK
jgi:glycosyltransferase involved in cell wall biosynthesis